MRNRVARILLLGTLVIPPMRCLAATPKEDFLRNYPAAAAKYENYFNNFQASGTLTTRFEPEKTMRQFRVQLYVDGQSSRLDRVYESGEKREQDPHAEVGVVTPDRTFLIEKPTPGSSYVVKAFGNTPDDASWFIEDMLLRVEICRYVYNKEVADLRGDKLIALDRFDYVDSGGRRLLKVQFRNLSPEKIYGGSGWFLLAPDRAWRIEKYEVQLNDGQFLSGSPEYTGEMDDGVPVLKSCTMYGKINENGFTETFVPDKIVHAPTPDSRFSLEEFGLGSLERAATPSRWNTPSAWIIGAAVLALIASLVMKTMADRRS